MASRIEKLNSTLRELQVDVSDIEAGALVSEDGLLLASALPPNIDQDNIGGVVALLIQLSHRAVTELDQGGMERVIIQSENGYSIVTKTTENASLVVLARKGSTLGLLLMKIDSTANKISKIL
ncbi:MAG: roadblock/LC7 domain-containing protein [Pseudomonadota bacterium]